jgi:hypothetical protein
MLLIQVDSVSAQPWAPCLPHPKMTGQFLLCFHLETAVLILNGVVA